MSIFVTDFEKSLILQSNFDWCFSILDKIEEHRLGPSMKLTNKSCFWFDDIENEIKGHHPPTKKHIEDLFEIFMSRGLWNTDKSVLINCRAGVSRSTATAIGLLVVGRHWKISQAFEQISIQRNSMWPNELVLSHFDSLCPPTDDTLVKFCKDWKEKQSYKIIRSKEFTENENDDN